jgi:RNA polymerase sigma-70 factor (ECF subfamily)
MTRSRSDALERILVRYADDLEAIVCRHVDDPMDRDDLRQEISVALWQAMPRFRGDSSERTYVARIAQNRAATFCLRLARRRALFSTLSDDVTAPRSDTGEHDVQRLTTLIASAVDRLPDGQRYVLALAAAGCPPSEIAERTGRSAGAVRVALHRARETVRDWLTRRTLPEGAR